MLIAKPTGLHTAPPRPPIFRAPIPPPAIDRGLRARRKATESAGMAYKLNHKKRGYSMGHITELFNETEKLYAPAVVRTFTTEAFGWPVDVGYWWDGSHITLTQLSIWFNDIEIDSVPREVQAEITKKCKEDWECGLEAAIEQQQQ
jgi:hypothetical protein